MFPLCPYSTSHLCLFLIILIFDYYTNYKLHKSDYRHLYIFMIVASSYPRSPNLCPEAVVDCVGKPQIFIQCSCLIAPPRDYESAL